MARTEPWSLTILTNNYAKGAGLRGEHGFSVHLERRSSKTGDSADKAPRQVLFDTGQTGEVLAHNADTLSIDLKEIDAVVLSHGHYDHTGGLDAVMQARRGQALLPVYAHPAAFHQKLRLHPRRRDIGSPFSRETLEGAGLELQLSEGTVRLSADLWVTGAVPRHHEFEKEAIAGFYTADTTTDAHDPVPDTIPDDQSLIVLSPSGGFHLVCGCCHAGLLNTLDYAAELSGTSRVRGIIGGLHTTGASPERLERTIGGLRDYDPDWIAPIHCSGQRETAVLHEALGDRVRFASVGGRFVLE